MEDTGKYSIEIGGVTCTAFLTVEEPDPTYTFLKPLPKKVSGYTLHETYMECVVSSNMAIVSWYKDEQKLEVSHTKLGYVPNRFSSLKNVGFYIFSKKVSSPISPL